VTVFGVSSDRPLSMALVVAGGARFPPLILVTTGFFGDLVVLEGHVRLTAFMLPRPTAARTGGAGQLISGDG
jgi:hypothetical protein